MIVRLRVIIRVSTPRVSSPRSSRRRSDNLFGGLVSVQTQNFATIFDLFQICTIRGDDDPGSKADLNKKGKYQIRSLDMGGDVVMEKKRMLHEIITKGDDGKGVILICSAHLCTM